MDIFDTVSLTKIDNTLHLVFDKSLYESESMWDLLEYYICNGYGTLNGFDLCPKLNNAITLITDYETIYYCTKELVEPLGSTSIIVFDKLCEYPSQLDDEGRSESCFTDLTFDKLIYPVVPRVIPLDNKATLMFVAEAGTNQYKQDCLSYHVSEGHSSCSLDHLNLAELTEKETKELGISKLMQFYTSNISNENYQIINNYKDIVKLYDIWEEHRFWEINR